jgi:hypothetical protein
MTITIVVTNKGTINQTLLVETNNKFNLEEVLEKLCTERGIVDAVRVVGERR